MAFMTLFRETNCAISCRTIVGDYIPQTVVQKIADEYYLITAALELVNVPLSIYIPFTKNLLGKRAAVSSHDQFTASAAAFKANMRIGETPTCIVGHWVLHMMDPRNTGNRSLQARPTLRSRRMLSGSSATRILARPSSHSFLPRGMLQAARLLGYSRFSHKDPIFLTDFERRVLLRAEVTGPRYWSFQWSNLLATPT